MYRNLTRFRTIRHFILALFVLMAHAHLSSLNGQTVATWTGAGDGLNYSDPANWSTGVVPINVGGTTFNVIVPNGQNIVFDVAGAISGISYGSGGSISLVAGVDFQVESVAAINSQINVSGANTQFNATGATVSLGNNVRLNSSDGGQIKILANDYVWSSNSGSISAFSAVGNGSIIDLSSLTTISNTGGNYYTSTLPEFSASAGGVLDLSGVTSISGGAGPDFGGNAENIFRIESGSDIVLSSLVQLTRYNRFKINRPDYSLPSLETAGGVTFEVADGSVLSLPKLLSVSGWASNFDVGQNATLDAPLLGTLNDTVVSIGNGGSVSMPGLTTMQNSSVTFQSSNTFTVGSLSNIDNSRIQVLDGLSLDISAPSYEFDRNLNAVALRASGSDSMINAFSMTSISNSGPNYYAQSRVSFIAEDYGVLDLSAIETIDGGGGPNSGNGYSENIFYIRSGGDVKLDSLRTLSQFNRFEIDKAVFALPSLETAGGVTFNLAVGSSLETPNLVEVDGWTSNATVPVFSSWVANNLTTMNDTSISISGGGRLTAPNLDTFENSAVSLESGSVFDVGRLSSIDNSRFSVSGGASLDVRAQSYLFNRNGGSTVFRANGLGSTIEASSLETISNTGPNYYASSRSYFVAENRGELNMSSVRLIDGGSGPNYGNGYAENAFIAKSGGRIQFGNVVATQYNRFEADGASSILQFAGIDFGSNSTLNLTNLARLELSGTLTHRHTDPTKFDVEQGVVVFNGNNSIAELEVAGEDLGTTTNALDNFAFGQLRIGDSIGSMTVILADRIDNGNRNTGAEVQYLLGFNGQGLALENGSTVVLNGLDMYISNGTNSFVSARSLIQPGEITVAYDGGAISLTGEVGNILNGTFEGDLKGFHTIGAGQAKVETPGDGNPVLKLTAGSPIEISQYISTLDSAYEIEFDAMALDSSGTLSLLLDDTLLQEWDYSELGNGTLLGLSYLADDPGLLGLIDVSLALRWDANTGDSVYVDNWRMSRVVPEPTSALVLFMFGVCAVGRRTRRYGC